MKSYLPANQLLKKCCNSVAGTHTMEMRRSLSAREQMKKVLGDCRAFLRHRRTSTDPLPITASPKMSTQRRPKTGRRALGSLGTATKGGMEYSCMNFQRERLEASSIRSRSWEVRFIVMVCKRQDLKMLELQNLFKIALEVVRINCLTTTFF